MTTGTRMLLETDLQSSTTCLRPPQKKKQKGDLPDKGNTGMSICYFMFFLGGAGGVLNKQIVEFS